MNPKILRPIAAALSFVLFSTNVLFAHSVETNFWKERGRPVQLAALPTDIGALPSITSRTALFPREIALPAGAPSSLRSIVAALPLNVGSIRKISVPKNASGRTVIHIQDVHQNLEAQTNIEQAVQSLIDKKTISLVGLEGAFGPMDLAWVRSHPVQNSVKAVADYLFREKRIAGPMHAAFVSKSAIPSFFGIDDKTHYDANVDAVRRSAGLSPAEKINLAKQLRELNAAKASVFNSRLKDFDAQVEAYRNGAVSWSAYVRSMSQRASSIAPSLTAYLTALSSEEKLDMAQVESQRAQLLEQLSRKLNPAETQNLLDHSAAYRTGELGHSDFYAFLKKLCADKCVELARYPSMNDYIRYVMLADSLDVDAIVGDAAALEKKLYASLAVSDRERALIIEERGLHLTEKLLSFALTKEEWEEYKEIQIAPGALASFLDFYDEAEIRDHKMAENLLASMDQSHSQVAAMVTGGFHSQGLSRQLQDRGVTVITYAPKVSKIDDETGSAYLSVFTQEKTPLDKLFAGEKLFLSPLTEPRRDAIEPMIALNARLGATENAGELKLPDGAVLHETRKDSQTILQFTLTQGSRLLKVAAVLAVIKLEMLAAQTLFRHSWPAAVLAILLVPVFCSATILLAAGLFRFLISASTKTADVPLLGPPYNPQHEEMFPLEAFGKNLSIRKALFARARELDLDIDKLKKAISDGDEQTYRELMLQMHPYAQIPTMAFGGPYLRFVWHVGVYYALKALYARSGRRVVVINVDPHSDVYTEIPFQVVTSANWARWLYHDGVATQYLRVASSLLKPSEPASLIVYLEAAMESIEHVYRDLLSPKALLEHLQDEDTILVLTFDGDWWSLSRRQYDPASDMRNHVYHVHSDSHIRKRLNDIGILRYLAALNRKPSLVVFADSPEYLSPQLPRFQREMWLERVWRIVQEECEAVFGLIEPVSTSLTFASTYARYRNDPDVVSAREAGLDIRRYIEINKAPYDFREIVESLVPVLFVVRHGRQSIKTFWTRLMGQLRMSSPFWIFTAVFIRGIFYPTTGDLFATNICCMILLYAVCATVSIGWSIESHHQHNINHPSAALTMGSSPNSKLSERRARGEIPNLPDDNSGLVLGRLYSDAEQERAEKAALQDVGVIHFFHPETGQICTLKGPSANSANANFSLYADFPTGHVLIGMVHADFGEAEPKFVGDVPPAVYSVIQFLTQHMRPYVSSSFSWMRGGSSEESTRTWTFQLRAGRSLELQIQQGGYSRVSGYIRINCNGQVFKSWLVPVTRENYPTETVPFRDNEKALYWTNHWDNSDVHGSSWIEEFFSKLEGNWGRILELGGNAFPWSARVKARGEIVVIDRGAPETAYRKEGALFLKGDAENLRETALAQAQELSQFFALFDTVVMTHLLNYVDFRKVIADLSATKPGTRVVIVNDPSQGVEGAFSPHGVKSSGDLMAALDHTVLEFVHIFGWDSSRSSRDPFTIRMDSGSLKELTAEQAAGFKGELFLALKRRVPEVVAVSLMFLLCAIGFYMNVPTSLLGINNNLFASLAGLPVIYCIGALFSDGDKNDRGEESLSPAIVLPDEIKTFADFKLWAQQHRGALLIGRQADLAKKLGISQAAVSRVMKENHISRVRENWRSSTVKQLIEAAFIANNRAAFHAELVDSLAKEMGLSSHDLLTILGHRYPPQQQNLTPDVLRAVANKPNAGRNLRMILDHQFPSEPAPNSHAALVLWAFDHSNQAVVGITQMQLSARYQVQKVTVCRLLTALVVSLVSSSAIERPAAESSDVDPFSRPSLTLPSRRARLAKNPKVIAAVQQEFENQLNDALEGKESSISALKTFGRQPTGKEQGRFISINWGGTNAVAMIVDLFGNGRYKAGTKEEGTKDDFKFDEADKENPAAAFDKVVKSIIGLIGDDKTTPMRIGFIFSFKMEQTSLQAGILRSWSKGWRDPETGEKFIGRDPGKVLQDRLHALGYTNIIIGALANDTLNPMIVYNYTVLGQKLNKVLAFIGSILGTGHNTAVQIGDEIFNLESGNFNGVEGVQSIVDRALDQEVTDPRPGAQMLEKMVSSKYLPEVLRRLMIQLNQEHPDIFKWVPNTWLNTPFQLEGGHLATFANDATLGLTEIRSFFESNGVPLSPFEAQTVRRLSRLIMRRSADLMAAHWAALVHTRDPQFKENHVIAVEGSLFTKNALYQDYVKQELRRLLGRRNAGKIKFASIDGAEGVGAAILAAMTEPDQLLETPARIASPHRQGKMNIFPSLLIETFFVVVIVMSIWMILTLFKKAVDRLLSYLRIRKAASRLVAIERRIRDVPEQELSSAVREELSNIDAREGKAGIAVSELLSRRVPDLRRASEQQPSKRFGLLLVLQLLVLAKQLAFASMAPHQAATLVPINVVNNAADVDACKRQLIAMQQLKSRKDFNFGPSVWSVSANLPAELKNDVIAAVETNMDALPVSFVVERESGFNERADGTYNVRTLMRVANDNRFARQKSRINLFDNLSDISKPVPVNVQLQILSSEAVPYAADEALAKSVWFALMGVGIVWIPMTRLLATARLAAKMA